MFQQNNYVLRQTCLEASIKGVEIPKAKLEGFYLHLFFRLLLLHQFNDRCISVYEWSSERQWPKIKGLVFKLRKLLFTSWMP